MRQIVWSLIVVIAFASCSNENTIPEEVLSEGKMRTVVWDMMRADEWVQYEHNKDSTLNRQKRSMELYRQVFQVNGITAAQFKKSFQFYQSRPDLLKPLLDSLQKRGVITPDANIQ